MITDARVLQQEFIPKEVKHRDNEVNYLSSILTPVTDGKTVEPTLLCGPSGVGKSCIEQFLVEELCRNVVNLNTQYVNCWEDYTGFKTLYQLLDGIGQSYDIHRQSTPRDLLVDRLLEKAERFVDLDEVLFDRGFYSNDVYATVHDRGLIYTSPVPKYEDDYEVIENIEAHETADAAVNHGVPFGHDGEVHHRAEFMYVPSRSDDADGKYAVFVTNRDRVEHDEIKSVCNGYRRR